MSAVPHPSARHDAARWSALNPAAALRRRFRAWWQARVPFSDTLVLTQRNIYIVPTRAGLMFVLTLLVLLVGTINYQLSLGYVLTFLLAGCGLTSMHITHATLRGLNLHLRPPAPVFAGSPALLDAVLQSPPTKRRRHGDRPRWGVGLRVADDEGAWTWVDVPAGGQTSTTLSFVPKQRGQHRVPTLRIETRFPLGLFRAWSLWRPASQVLVYPQPELPAAPLPTAHAVAGQANGARRAGGDETEGLRGYRRGDSMKQIVWKKSARTLDSTGDLVSRDTSQSARRELWLDYQAAAVPGTEPRLSRLAAWVLAADRMGADYGLRLPGHEAAPSHGEAHKRASLEALALWR